MKPDDPVCLCFHVTRRKVVSFIRVEKPRLPSQLSECFGAGTGCGWCRSYLERLLKEEIAKTKGATVEIEGELSFQEYSQGRADYVKEGGGTPPSGAIPIEDGDGLPS